MHLAESQSILWFTRLIESAIVVEVNIFIRSLMFSLIECLQIHTKLSLARDLRNCTLSVVGFVYVFHTTGSMSNVDIMFKGRIKIHAMLSGIP